MLTGKNDVGIPTHLFKVIYIFNYNETLKHEVYLVRNKAIKSSGERKNPLEAIALEEKEGKDKTALLLQKYETNIKEIQKLTGMNFEEYYESNYPDWLNASDLTE